MFKYNLFLFKDLPSAWLCGVRIIKLNESKIEINKIQLNPLTKELEQLVNDTNEISTFRDRLLE